MFISAVCRPLMNAVSASTQLCPSIHYAIHTDCKLRRGPVFVYILATVGMKPSIAVLTVCTFVTSCGAGHNKPRPRDATYRKAKNSNFVTFLVARWQHRTARRPKSNQITNNLTFDPPTRLPELTQNWIKSSHGHFTPSLKISCKSVQPFSRNLADKETKKKQRKKEIARLQYPVLLPGVGGGGVISSENRHYLKLSKKWYLLN